MFITASIVTYHTKQDVLNRLIDCVMRSPIEVLYLVDNTSHDALREKVASNPKIHYIHSINRGYGAGHNIALRLAMDAGTKYHVVLNPDIYWKDDVIAELARFMETHENCGLTMPRILYPDGSLQRLCKLLPSPVDLVIRRFVPIRALRRRLDYRYEMQWADYDKIMEVPSLSGCFMFLRCSILQQIGLFDERFFMYAEDLDFCRRIGEATQTIYNPSVSIYHEYKKGSYKNKKLLKYHIISIIKYFNKWGWFFDTKRRQKNRICKNKILN